MCSPKGLAHIGLVFLPIRIVGLLHNSSTSNLKIMNIMKHIVLYFIFGLLGCVCCLSSAWAADRPLVLKSPGGNLEVEIITEGQLAYALKQKGKILLDKSPIGLVLEDRTLDV